MVYTNIDKWGGKLFDVLLEEFENAESIRLASGYVSLDIIESFGSKFLNVASKGNVKILLGMAFYEGLGQRKLDELLQLNQNLNRINPGAGIYVANGRRYHGKVYQFKSGAVDNVYVGSSNFSSSGLKGNIECTMKLDDITQKSQVINFLDDLYSPDYSILLNEAEIRIKGQKNAIKKAAKNKWDSLRLHSLKPDLSELECLVIPLEDVVKKHKSNLNVYFGKGRLNQSTGKIQPRPWYEIELIANRLVRQSPLYPKGNFEVYTDDGYVLPMKTQGDNYKNIRSTGSLQIFGRWLKGKLESKGVLDQYEPVTLETLQEYGNANLLLYRIDETKYFIKF